MNEWPDFSRELVQGGSHIFRYQIVDTAGTPINIGPGGPYGEWTHFWHTAKLSALDADAAAVFQRTFTLLAQNGITIVTASTGLLQIEIVPANTTTGIAYVRRTQPLVSDVKGRDGNGRLWTSKRGLHLLKPVATRASS